MLHWSKQHLAKHVLTISIASEYVTFNLSSKSILYLQSQNLSSKSVLYLQSQNLSSKSGLYLQSQNLSS